MKAMKRARQQAAERGESLASCVADRHGTLAQLTQGLSDRNTAPGACHVRVQGRAWQAVWLTGMAPWPSSPRASRTATLPQVLVL